MKSDLIERARELARLKHQGMHLPDRVRTSAYEHLSEVAALVEEHGGTDAMIAAAWLHDIVEDTDISSDEIAEHFGPEVGLLVDGLTDPPHYEALPLEQRKQLQAGRIRGLIDDVKRIKLCDQLSNTRRVLRTPPLDWTRRKQWTYIRGARTIAVECRGLWPRLDQEFALVFEAARKQYRADTEQ